MSRLDSVQPDLGALDTRHVWNVQPGHAQPPPKGKRLVMLGRPGSGKGIQSACLATALDVTHIALGDALRAAWRAGSPLGQAVEPYLASGRLLPDGVVAAVVADELDKAGSAGFVLDGFPRTLRQAELLTTLLRSETIDAAISLVVRRAVALHRLNARRICRECGLTVETEDRACRSCGGELTRRPDDWTDSIALRLATFDAQARPLTRWYAERGLLRVVDGHGPIDEVARRMLEVVSPTGSKTSAGVSAQSGV